jgi:chromosome segregation ATPase
LKSERTKNTGKKLLPAGHELEILKTENENLKQSRESLMRKNDSCIQIMEELERKIHLLTTELSHSDEEIKRLKETNNHLETIIKNYEKEEDDEGEEIQMGGISQDEDQPKGSEKKRIRKEITTSIMKVEEITHIRTGRKKKELDLLLHIFFLKLEIEKLEAPKMVVIPKDYLNDDEESKDGDIPEV